jgi:hypothetical protein
MLSADPNIIFIDDKEKEVNGIIESYRKEGHGVKFFNADLYDGDTPPKSYFFDVNLIFLDLFYNENYDLERCTGWIEKIIPENTFYILVLWSKDTHYSEEIIEDLIKLNRKPYSLISAQKSDYVNDDNTLNFEKLSRTVEEKLNEQSELEELSIWKKSIKSSSNQIIGHLTNDEDINVFKRRLKKIIVGHGGSSLISLDKFKQKREVLFDALDQVLVSNAKGSRPEIKISELNETELYSIETNIQTDIDSKLNSWFHFNLHKDPMDQNNLKLGLISEFKNSHLAKHYRIIDDPNVVRYLKNQIEKSREENSKTEFINICMVLIRPCDLAQNKYGRNVKLLSGVLVKKPFRKKNKFNSSITKPDSIKLFDHLHFSKENNDLALLFDFRYVFSISEKTFKDKFNNIKIFNKELLSEVQVEYSSYSSRLGITQII